MTFDKLKRFLESDTEIRGYIKNNDLFSCYETLRYRGFSSKEIGYFSYMLFNIYDKDLNILLNKIGSEIPSEMFSYFDFGDSINVPDTVSGIEASAFFQSQFREVFLPGSITKLGDGAFEECDFLTDVWIAGSVNYIPEYFLYNCGKPCTLHINDNIKEIRKQAILNNKPIITLEYFGTVERFKNIKLSHSWCDGSRVEVKCDDGKLIYKDSRLVEV